MDIVIRLSLLCWMATSPLWLIHDEWVTSFHKAVLPQILFYFQLIPVCITASCKK
jgi:hypothetical protein